jgi:MFS family permease
MTTAKAIPSDTLPSAPLDVMPAWTPARSSVGEHNPWLITVIIAIPVFLEILDTTIANVALGHIAGGLGAGVDESTWVITSYLVANAVILPISGWLSEVIGRKQFYVLCVALFTLASFLCGTAWAPMSAGSDAHVRPSDTSSGPTLPSLMSFS